jgi:hypothetical protein
MYERDTADDRHPPGRPRSWWVRRRYVIAGNFIRPVRGATVEDYDPYAEDASQRPAYLELAGLDTTDERAVEEFVSRWGLLGLFFHPLLQIQLASSRSGDADRAYTVRDLLRSDCSDPVTELLEQDPAVKGTATLWDSGRGEYSVRDLERYCHDYFPDLRTERGDAAGEPGDYGNLRRHPFVILASGQLWDYLSEPLDAFRAAAADFQAFFADCVRWSEGSGGSEDARTARRLVELQGRVESHLRHVYPVFGYEVEAGEIGAASEVPGPDHDSEGWWERPVPPGRLTLEWVYPSLLSGAYGVLLRDLMSGRHLRYCANETCGRPMVADNPTRIYCSERCLNTTRHRAFRRRQAERRKDQLRGER